MKFLAGLAVAASLASSTAAAAASAPVYLIRSASSSSTTASSSPSGDATSASPDLPRQIVRQILLARLDADYYSSFFDTLPRDFDPDTALDLIQRFGDKTTPTLFSDKPVSQLRKLLVVVQGAKPEHVAAVEAALPSTVAKPAFSVADPPSKAANTRLFLDELAGEGITTNVDSAIADATAPESWESDVFVGLYDVKKDTKTVDSLLVALPQIVALVESGILDASILLLPESSRFAQWKDWESNKGLKPADAKILPPKAKAHALPNAELRAREADSEFVMTEDNSAPVIAKEDSSPALGSGSDINTFAGSPIPGCFQSFNSCIAATNNCSEHGTCIDKYAANNGGIAGTKQEAAASCFVCHCYRTLNRPETDKGGLSTTQWAGNMCQKKDVSIPFWLITGFTVAIVGAVSFSIGLLFSVGEEKLPGVIGAGVSRTK
ncbi:hypothetical protein SCUCBS95973_007773 [Sporothrix curviconia]|uniref:Vacuolar sorting protein Vps3844 C-terminal domain-containing protein n=1 Tax=Sporothrix curviconia TaxID=1260050 RepID=A0ABP0CG37_9PEZI